MPDEIPLRCYFAATKSTRGQMASAVTLHAATRPRSLAIFGAVFAFVLAALVALRDESDRVPRGLALALAITVAAAVVEVVRAWVAAYRSLGRTVVPAARLQSGFAAGRVRLHSEADDEVHAFDDLAAFDLRGRFALLRTRADGARWFVYPRALFPDAEVARIREVLASPAPRAARAPRSPAPRPTAALDLPAVAPTQPPAPPEAPEVRAPAAYRGTPPPPTSADNGPTDIRDRAVARERRTTTPPPPEVVEPPEGSPEEESVEAVEAVEPVEAVEDAHDAAIAAGSGQVDETSGSDVGPLGDARDAADLPPIEDPITLADLFDELPLELDRSGETDPGPPAPEPVAGEPAADPEPPPPPTTADRSGAPIPPTPPIPVDTPRTHGSGHEAGAVQRYVATPGTAGRLARAALVVRLRQPGTTVAAPLVWATLTAVVFSAVGGTTGARIAVGAAVGLLVTVGVVAAWVALTLSRLTTAATATAPAGATLEVELGHRAVRVRTPLDDLTLQHRGLAAVLVAGDVVVLRGQGGTLDLALPRELFPEEELTRLRAIVRRGGR